jgi:hypothetical protein|tara:strand:- start:101 stop:598 length:498 start_codon:yes stop_codon:yes gene_type:complete
VIVIVFPLLLVNELVAASVNPAPPFLPVQVGFAAFVHTAVLAVKTTVFESAVIAVAVVALSTIFVGVAETVVTSTSPSIAVIAVTELYVTGALGVTSAVEAPVAVNAVIVAGFTASSPAVLHVSTMSAWFPPLAAPESVIVMVSAARPATDVVVMALVRVGVDPV